MRWSMFRVDRRASGGDVPKLGPTYVKVIAVVDNFTCDESTRHLRDCPHNSTITTTADMCNVTDQVIFVCDVCCRVRCAVCGVRDMHGVCGVYWCTTVYCVLCIAYCVLCTVTVCCVHTDYVRLCCVLCAVCCVYTDCVRLCGIADQVMIECEPPHQFDLRLTADPTLAYNCLRHDFDPSTLLASTTTGYRGAFRVVYITLLDNPC